MVVAIVAAVAIVVAAIAFVTVGLPGASSDAAQSGANAGSRVIAADSGSAAADASGGSASGDGASVGQDAQEADGGSGDGQDGDAQRGEDAAVPASTPASARIDLLDPATYVQVNTFLSNFSEVGLDMPSVASASAQQLATFAVKHVGRNSREQWELCSSDNPGWGLPADNQSGGADGMRSWRIPASRVDELSQRYFGRSVDFDAIALGKNAGWVAYLDGYCYFGTTNGAGAAEGVALARSATDQADGTVRIEFDVYNNWSYDVADSSWYGCSPEEIMARMNVSAPYRSGVAVVRQGDYSEYTGGLVLVSFQM